MLSKTGDQTMKRKESKQINKLFEYPLMEALARRRTRRFPVGCATQGSMPHASQTTPVPLNDTETAILCWAGGGISGIVASDLATTGGNVFCTWLGKTTPHPCNSHTSKLFFTNDNGVFIYEPKTATKIVEIDNEVDREKIMKYFKEDTRMIDDQRMMAAPEGVLTGQHWNVNRPGTSIFMPIIDLTEEYINFLIGVFQGEGYQLFDDLKGKPAGIQKWIDNGALKGPQVPMTSFEYFVFSASMGPAFMAIQNVQLVAEAMGLGSIPIAGYTSVIILGGTPISKGLGFDFVVGKNGQPACVGKKGAYETLCPPYKTMNEAVDAFVARKFGPEGIFTPEYKGKTAFRDMKKALPGYEPITHQAIEITKDYCNYIYDTYGRFPACHDAIVMPMWIQVHHIEIEWYEKYQAKEIINETHRNHMNFWHNK